jgi:FKBP-type peptidyl-prolyl cis-trans isomerase (trigger factor)
MWYDKTLDIIEAWVILKLIWKWWAFYSIWSQKFQWKEKLAQAVENDEKVKKNLEKDIQNKIKEMRMWKKVLDDAALVIAQDDVEDQIAEVASE